MSIINFIKKLRRFILLHLPALYGYAETKKEIADVFKKPLANFEKLSADAKTRNRQTQVQKYDSPIKLIYKRGDYFFGKLVDQTLGWMHISELKWTTWTKSRHDKNIKKIDLNEAVKKYLNTPYLLGGTTKKGIDCSGLSQRIYKEVYDIILAKHSKDQAKFGKKINLENAKEGDLIFFSRLDKNLICHVGIIIDPKKKIILHASEKRKVSLEELDGMTKRYKVICINTLN